MGLLNMPMPDAPKMARMPKPAVDMPGPRTPLRKKRKVRKPVPVIDSRAIQRVKGAL